VVLLPELCTVLYIGTLTLRRRMKLGKPALSISTTKDSDYGERVGSERHYNRKRNYDIS
jgi:hypothetical protein